MPLWCHNGPVPARKYAVRAIRNIADLPGWVALA